jgi:hypothetical protein
MNLDDLLRHHLQQSADLIDPPAWPDLEELATDDLSSGVEPRAQRRGVALLVATVIVALALSAAMIAKAGNDTPAGVATAPGSSLQGAKSGTVPPNGSVSKGTLPPPEPEVAILATVEGEPVAGSSYRVVLRVRGGGAIEAYRFRPTSFLQRWSGAAWVTTDTLVSEPTPQGVVPLCGQDFVEGMAGTTNRYTPVTAPPLSVTPDSNPCRAQDHSLPGVPTEEHFLPDSARAGAYRLCRDAVRADVPPGSVDPASAVHVCARFALSAPPMESYAAKASPCPGSVPGPSNPDAAKGVTDAEWLAQFKDLPEADRLAKLAELQEVRDNRTGLSLHDGTVVWINRDDFRDATMPTDEPGATVHLALPVFRDDCTIYGYYLSVPNAAPGSGGGRSIIVPRADFESGSFDALTFPPVAGTVQADVPR